MDIWIIRDGEKVGPIHDFEVRKQIESGQLPGSTPAWHEGLAAWKPLIEIELFTREFESKGPPPLPSTMYTTRENAATVTTPVVQTTHYVRRFWARWLDLLLYAGIWWLAMWAAKQDIEGILRNPWIIFLQYVPWFALEAFLIHKYGTTLGKWLLGLRVVNKDDSLLDLSDSIRRSLRVMFTGVGFGWSVLAVFCQALSLFTAKRLGTTLWDHTGGHQVVAQEINPFRLIALVFLFAGAIQLQMLVVSPYAMKMAVEQYPELRENYEKMNLWHLPKRS
jgi:uncharacterized RDD family membrane protein YckC